MKPPHFPFIRRLCLAGWISLIIHAQVLFAQTTPTPSFLEEPSDQEVNPGDNMDLKCRLNQAVTVIWLKDGNIQNVGTTGVYASSGDPASNEHTIRISGVSMDRDDGLWECQALVPGSTNALRSRKARLVVRVPPRDRPTLQLAGSPLRNGDELQARSDMNATITCIARDSNPPAGLKWWIGTKDVSDFAQTINQTVPNGKLYNTISTLTYQFQPEDNGGQLKCEISHPALAGSLSTYAHLNILYAPIITMEQQPAGDLVEGQDVILSCFAPANPPAVVKWYQNGREIPLINSSSFQLEKLSHEFNGNYTCIARSSVFDAVRAVYNLAVRYVPVFTTLPHSDNVDLEQNVMLYCDAEGNPTPRIQWFQNTTDGQTIQLAEARNLSINVDYSSQGKYWCRASNTINNNENIVLSDAAELFVKGKPQFEASTANGPRTDITGDKSAEATLSAIYCSQPPPTNFYWQREQRPSDKQRPGTPIAANNQKYQTSIRELPRRGCYESRLKVLQLDQSDAGRYRFMVENEKGSSFQSVQLNVRDSSTTSLIVGIVVGLGSALLLGLVAIVCCYRTKRFCFATTKSFSNGDIEKREGKSESELIRSTRHKEDNLKQNPLQTESIVTKTEYKVNGINGNGYAHHIISNGGNDLTKKPQVPTRLDGIPADVLHYNQLDLPSGPSSEHDHGSPRFPHENVDYADIRPTVL